MLSEAVMLVRALTAWALLEVVVILSRVSGILLKLAVRANPYIRASVSSSEWK